MNQRPTIHICVKMDVKSKTDKINSTWSRKISGLSICMTYSGFWHQFNVRQPGTFV